MLLATEKTVVFCVYHIIKFYPLYIMDKIKTNHYVQKGGKMIKSINEIESDDTDLIFGYYFNQPIEKGFYLRDYKI